MQQLVIKLSPAATAQYLAIASAKTQKEMENDMEASGVQLGINMSMISGLHFTDIDVNGQAISTQTDDEDLQLELIELNWLQTSTWLCISTHIPQNHAAE